MARPQAVSTQQLQNDRAIVTEWRIAPGSETGWHVHGHDYVIVPQTDGELTLETKSGTHVAAIRAGQSYAGPKGNDHNVVNATDKEIVFIEIEIR